MSEQKNQITVYYDNKTIAISYKKNNNKDLFAIDTIDHFIYIFLLRLMKKIAILLSSLMLLVSGVRAYTPTANDQQLADSLTNKVEQYLMNNPDNRTTLRATFEEMQQRYVNNNEAQWLLGTLLVVINNESSLSIEAHSQVSRQWWGHNGYINVVNWSATVADDTITAGTFTLDMTSIKATDMNNKKLDSHIRTMVGSSNHPTAIFTITSMSDKGDDTYAAQWQLTLKGNTKDLSFDATITETANGKNIQAAFPLTLSLRGINAEVANVTLDVNMQ